jgi:hypothetical protein
MTFSVPGLDLQPAIHAIEIAAMAAVSFEENPE